MRCVCVCVLWVYANVRPLLFGISNETDELARERERERQGGRQIVAARTEQRLPAA